LLYRSVISFLVI